MINSMLPFSILNYCRYYSFDETFFEVDVPVFNVTHFFVKAACKMLMKSAPNRHSSFQIIIHYFFPYKNVLLLSCPNVHKIVLFTIFFSLYSYRAFHRFGLGLFAFDGLVLDLNVFRTAPTASKKLLTSKMIKRNS